MSGSRVIMRSPISLHGKPSGPAPRRMRSALYCVPVRPNSFNLASTLRLERVGGAQQREIGFLLAAGEGNLLFQFGLQTAGHSVEISRYDKHLSNRVIVCKNL